MLLDGQATLTLPAQRWAAELPRLYEWLEALLEEMGFLLRPGQGLLLCTHEIFNDIASCVCPDGEQEGYSYISRNIVPMLAAHNVSVKGFKKILRKNPPRMLTI